MVEFRRKRETVDAVQFLPGNVFNEEAMRQHLQGMTGWQMDDTALVLPNEYQLNARIVRPGDYVIKETDGRYSVQAKSQFEAEYEREQ